MSHVRLRPLVPAALVTVALVAGCTTAAGPRATGSGTAPEGLVLLTTSAGVEAVSLATGSRRYQLAGAMTTAGGDRVVATAGRHLVVLDARSGTVTRTIAVPAGLSVGAISGDSRLVALTAAGSAGAGYLPPGRPQTPIVIVDLSLGSVTPYRLDGNLIPEAFSRDDRRLFVIDYLPAAAPNRYLISSLDLTTSEINGVFGREKEAPEEMQGVGRTHVVAPDGSALYTLYLRPTASGGSAVGADATHAEVHTLSLDGGWAHCIDLPEGFGAGDLSTASFAVAPDGAHLYVVDGQAHRLAEIETGGLTVTRTASLLVARRPGPTTVAVGSGGHLFVGDGDGVAVVSIDSLAPLTRWFMSSPVIALAASPSGGVVAGTVDQVNVFDATGGVRTTAHPAGNVIAIDQVLAGRSGGR